MELSQLRTFREVADALSFTRAAQKLNMTQSAVSHQIKALELELGEPLFIRAKRGVRLSDAGKLALEYAARIIEEADALREHISGRDHEPRGRVRAAAATQAFVHLEQGASIRRATDAFFKRVELSPALALESNDTYFIKLMVEHGLGVSVMPSWAVREEVEAGRLAWLRVSGHRLTRAVAVIALGRFQPSPTRAFIEYVLEHRERLQEAARPS